MQAFKELVDYYNDFFINQADFKVIEPFVINEDKKLLKGKIKSERSNVELNIDVAIPFNFPYQELHLTTHSISGYPHLIHNADGFSRFCLNTPFIESIELRLQLEIDRLNEWIETYLNHGKQDRHYDYLILPRDQGGFLFFSETVEDFSDNRFLESSYGEFKIYKSIPDGGQRINMYFADMLGNKPAAWSQSFMNGKNEEKAYWVYVGNEPVKKDKTAYSTWTELCENCFQNDFVAYIKTQIRIEYTTWKKKFLTNKSLGKKYNYNIKSLRFRLPLAIGYQIPSEHEEFEIHWEFAYLYYKEGKTKEEISWLYSKNIAESRYFGRGGFCNNLMEASILIIGLGALGSSVAEILVRGGIKNLSLADGDLVDTGNICRSVFDLNNFFSNKAITLSKNLQAISPFVNIGVYDNYIQGQPHFAEEFTKLSELFEKYDIIFDCTGSNELLYFLSSLKTENIIVSLGITNQANHLLCVTNSAKDSLYDKRKIALYSLGEIVPPSFYEGTGCFYPTFEASFFDINALLNLSLRHIDHQYNATKRADSFHISYTNQKVDICDYVVFYQNELGFSLTIFQSCIDFIYSLARLNYPLEFGGTLVGGYSDNGKHVYITDVLIPDRFINSPVYFKGDTIGMNKELETLFKQSHGNIIYLGDWHSHPNMSNNYSNVDFKSIERQARSSLVSINNPILAIISIGRKHSEIGYYIYYENKLYKFS